MAKPATTVNGLQAYPAYKPSGVGWLGDVPAHWVVVGLRHRYQQCLGKMLDSKRITGEHLLPYLRNVDVQWGKVNVVDLPMMDILPVEIDRYTVQSEDLIVCEGGEVGRCAIWHGESGVLGYQKALHRLRPHRRDQDDPRFMYHTLRHAVASDAFNDGHESTIRHLTGDKLRTHRFPFPTLTEQAAIARYLDHADEHIRRCVQSREKLVELLEEQRQALVSEVVTGRFDVRTGQPYPAYKPSGVEWLGEVPAHWVVASLRHRYQQCLGKMLDSKRITGEHLLPYLRNVDVQWGKVNLVDLPLMDILPVEIDRYTLQSRDLIVCEGGEVGRCAIWHRESGVFGYQKALHRLRPHRRDQDNPRFMYHTLRHAVASDAFNDGHESTIRHLTGDKLRAHRFPFPPLPEQAAIARYLDHADEHTQLRMRHAQRQIELLNEYRTRLISDVVTGKLDVRQVVAALPEVDRLSADNADDVPNEHGVARPGGPDAAPKAAEART